jgi:histidinol-phosphate/aromatic aminotransferase/cobyric acid decarboxylase-like protein
MTFGLAAEAGVLYGMAGMRIGYAIDQPETMAKVGRAWGLGSMGEVQAVAGLTALKDTAHMDRERQENRRIREAPPRRS